MIASSIQPILGFLPQHVWEVGAGAMAVLFMARGLGLIMKDPGAAGAANMSKLAVRASGSVIFVLGIGVGFAALHVNAESSAERSSGHWGGSWRGRRTRYLACAALSIDRVYYYAK